MHDYLTVRSNGFVTYCDGLIASIQADQARAYLLSLVGSPAQIQSDKAVIEAYLGREDDYEDMG